MVSAKLVVVLAGFFLVFLVAGCLGPPAPSPSPLPTQEPGASFSERCASPASDSALNVEPTPIVDECERQKALQPESCTALNGDTGITGSLVKPKILNEWSWSIPSDAMDASNPKGVYGDAHQFFIALFKKLKHAQDIAEDQGATRPIETLLSFELLLKLDNFSEALKAFDESRNTQFFDAPSWFTEKWFVLSQIPESGNPVLQFSPAEITSPGRYRVRVEFSNPAPAVSGQEGFFVVTQDGQPMPRYNTLTVSFEKTAEPEPANPLYWISLDAGLKQGSDFGVQFTTENDSENQSLLWTNSLDTSGFSLGQKNVLLLSGNSFEAINNPEMSGMILRMHPQAEWMIFSPNSPVSIAARLNSSTLSSWAYRFIQDDSSWSPENASSALIWNVLTSTSPTCEDVPRNVQDQWENQSDCDNGPGFSAQLSPIGNSSTTGEILATTTVFVPANQDWSMQSCTKGVPLADTAQVQNNNAFDLESNPNAENPLGVRSIQDVMNGVENESICVVTQNKDGTPLDETRFEWSAKALQGDQISAAGKLGVSNFTACPFYSEPAAVECPISDTDQPEPLEKEIRPDLYNAGFQILEIPYYTANGQTKMLPMAVWYPTTAPTASHLYSSLQPESEVAVDAPIAEGKFPLVLFAHGNMTTAIQSVFLTEYLAQRGYVVAATDYDDALFDSRTGDLIWPGGAPFFAVWFPDQWSDGSPALYRRDESHWVLKQLCSLNADSGNQFFGHLDFSRLGAVGWSLGGYTVAGLIGGYASWREPDIKAAVLQAPFLTPFQFNGGDLSRISVPVMIQGGTADFFTTGSPSLQELAEKINPPKYFLVFKDFDHFSWTDVPCQKFTSVPECRSDSKNQAVLFYTTSFLDYYLKGDSAAKSKLDTPNPLLTVFEHQD